MTDQNRTYVRSLWKDFESIQNLDSEHSYLVGTLIRYLLKDTEESLPTLFSSLLDLLIDVSVKMSRQLRLYHDDGSLVVDPGAYILDRENPQIRFSEYANSLGNSQSIEFSRHQHKFADDNLSKYFRSLAKQLVVVKAKIIKLNGISSSFRIDSLMKLHQQLVRFSQREADLRRALDDGHITILKKRVRKIDQDLMHLRQRIRKLIQEEKRISSAFT